ncbi:unnamed protein product, partial [Prorocentrum cordatum]
MAHCRPDGGRSWTTLRRPARSAAVAPGDGTRQHDLQGTSGRHGQGLATHPDMSGTSGQHRQGLATHPGMRRRTMLGEEARPGARGGGGARARGLRAQRRGWRLVLRVDA